MTCHPLPMCRSFGGILICPNGSVGGDGTTLQHENSIPAIVRCALRVGLASMWTVILILLGSVWMEVGGAGCVVQCMPCWLLLWF